MQLNLGRLGSAVLGRYTVQKTMAVALIAAACASHAQESTDSSPTNVKVHPEYVLGASLQKWPGGQISWYYNPANQPANLSTDAVLNAIQTAAARWSGMCNVTYNYKGLTSTPPYMGTDPSAIDRVNVIGWGTLPSGNNSRAITPKWWIGSTMVDNDVLMNTAFSWTIANVDALMTQALGNGMGLDFSNDPASVLFSNPGHDGNYVRTLRGDDALGCAALYGAAPTAESDRAFNWAEATFPQYLAPSPASSGNYAGYYYRYYPTLNSYVGTKDGSVFFMGPDGVIQNMGGLSGFFSLAQKAGF